MQIMKAGTAWITAHALSVIVIIAIIFFVSNHSYAQNAIPSNNQLNQSQDEAISSTRSNPSPWNLTLPLTEVLSRSSQSENSFIYAIKSKVTSEVLIRNMKNGSESKLFDYDEIYEADKSGNYWKELTPSIHLSPDKKQLAFTDKEGLKTFDLQSRISLARIWKVEDCPPTTISDDCSPTWSVDMKETYYLAKPLWSSDGKYIGFEEAFSECGGVGLLEVESGAYLSLNYIHFIDDFTWSPSGHGFSAISDCDFCSSNGLYISSRINIEDTFNMLARPGIIEERSSDGYFPRGVSAAISPDGRKLFFIYQKQIDDMLQLAIANIDGTSITYLYEEPKVRNAIFSTNGDYVLYFQRTNDHKQILRRYDPRTKGVIDLIIFPSEYHIRQKPFWSKDGYLVLVANIIDPNERGSKKRLLILDIDNRNIIYASPISGYFTTYAGLSN